MADLDKKPKLSIVEIAKQRYERFKTINDTARQLSIEDTRFVMGDSDNKWQWPEEVYSNRAEINKKPCLTINITAQHCNQIINNIRQNRPSAKILGVDSNSDPDTAEIIGGMIRSIQSYSDADTAHDIAAEHSIYGGEGFWRVLTEYEHENSFDQCIKIKSLTNPQLVCIDPDAIEPDKSDARWGMIFEDISRDQAREDHPKADFSSWVEGGEWVKPDTIRRAEYYWCEDEPDTLYLLGSGEVVRKSEIPEGFIVKGELIVSPAGEIQPIVDKRESCKKVWYWCKLLGGEPEPIDKRVWPGSYLPIISIVGKELNVNGEIVRKGVVRDLKDPARMVNYSYSATVETVALQNKVPYIAAAEAIDAYKDMWGAANLDNAAYLPYDAYDSNGQSLPMPQRQQPAAMATAQVQLLGLSVEQMRAASGQQNANFGIKSEAQSGVGIQRLKAQGEIATFHFPDNLARGLKYEARVLIDLIPKIYKSQRIVRILGMDGKEESAMLNPEMSQAFAKSQDKRVSKIFNPTVGRYDVTVDTGPSYQTQRQEAAQNLTEITKTNPALMAIAGDLVMRAYDFPMAQEIADRIEKTIDPKFLENDDEKPQIPQQVEQAMQQMDEQLKQAMGALENAAAEVERLEGELQGKDAKIAQEQLKTQSVQLDLQKERAIGEIKDAQQELVMQGAEPKESKEHEAREAQRPQQQPIVVLDSTGQFAGSLGPVMESLAASIQTTGEAVAVIAQGQQQLINDMAMSREQDQAMLMELQRPKQSQVRIAKQPDGSFVGERMEA